MELVMQEVKACSDDDNREEDEEEEEEGEAEEAEAEITKDDIISSSKNNQNQNQNRHHPYPLFSTNHKNRHQNSWLGVQDGTDSPNCSSGLLGLASPSSNFMTLSLSRDIHNESEEIERASSSHSNHHHHNNNNNSDNNIAIEKEHMFDKVVTPSDVGKLNRLVIPKQHAEKYFPLDSSSNDKGLLLNFEDRNGKLWRFRYSYWNSSQSYVMTKGWSRFVKEKKLDAGDIVSFQRGAADAHRHRLFIDWRRRPDHHGHHHHHHHHPASDPNFVTPFLFHHHHPTQPPMSIRWSGRLYSLPHPTQPPPPRPQLNYSNMFPFQKERQQHHHWQQHQQQQFNYNNAMNSVYHHPSLIGQQDQNIPMIIDSVPVDHYHHHQQLQQQQQQLNEQNHHDHFGKSDANNNAATAGKRLRLFGVNMECASSSSSNSSPLVEQEEPNYYNVAAMAAASNNNNNNNNINNSSINILSSPSPPTLHHQYMREDPISSSSSRFQNQQKLETTMFFDLDPSLQYRQ